jgi:crotonobetainyl-CoA:carnitine CoA-transferase CaiB-like acyl-CoA transferase
MSVAITAAITAVATVLASGGLWAYLQARRTGSGRVITTPAETLWQQMQQMLTGTQARLDKTEEQRDKLLDTVGAIQPTLASIDSSLRQLLELATQPAKSEP